MSKESHSQPVPFIKGVAVAPVTSSSFIQTYTPQHTQVPLCRLKATDGTRYHPVLPKPFHGLEASTNRSMDWKSQRNQEPLRSFLNESSCPLPPLLSGSSSSYDSAKPQKCFSTRNGSKSDANNASFSTRQRHVRSGAINRPKPSLSSYTSCRAPRAL